MNHELAKTLTTALVQFIDREQPKDKMCMSSVEAEELERCFTEEKFDKVEDWYAYRMKPELTEFELALRNAMSDTVALSEDKEDYVISEIADKQAKRYSAGLLALAKKELCRGCNANIEGYIKGREDAEKRYNEGYNKGYEDAEKQYNESVAYHYPTMPQRPLCWEPGGTCINPHFDCINCPRQSSNVGTITSPNKKRNKRK